MQADVKACDHPSISSNRAIMTFAAIRPPDPAADDARPSRASRATSDFTTLAQRVHEAGLMRRRYGYYWAKLIASVVALGTWVVAFVWVGDSWWQLLSAAVLAVLLTQIAFLGHDAAHRQMFKSGAWNDWVSLIVANLMVGISHGWWKSKHNRHHAAPNKEGADPDIDLGVIAMTPQAASRRRNPVLQWLVARQGSFFFPILFLEGLSLHLSGVRRVLGRGKIERRWVEIALLTSRLAAYLTLVFLVLPPAKAAAFLALQVGLFGFYLGASFAPNHIGMPLVTAQLKLDFLRRQVLTSRNIRGGVFMSVLMGGLNHQVEHHLFPSMPRPHLRRAAPLVAAHCAAIGVPYTQTTLWQSYAIVTRYLNTVGLKNRDTFLCPLVAQRRAG
jgi:fatty acid desaturase